MTSFAKRQPERSWLWVGLAVTGAEIGDQVTGQAATGQAATGVGVTGAEAIGAATVHNSGSFRQDITATKKSISRCP